MNKFNYTTGSGPLKRFVRPESIDRVVLDSHLRLNFFNILSAPRMYNKFFASYSGCRLARYCSQFF